MGSIHQSPLGLTLTLAAPGAQAYSVALSRFAAQLRDFRPFWTGGFRDLWRPHVIQVFRTEGAVTGQRWRPLSAAYARAKARAGYAHEGILVRGGSLSASLMSPDSDPLGVWEPKALSLTVGTRRRFAAVHQLGSADGRIPARPFARPSPGLLLAIGKELQKFSAAAWKQQRQDARAYGGA